MPPFDNVSRSKLISENNDNYSRLLAVFSDGATRIDNRVAVVFKNDKQFESAARSAQSSTYQRMAGTDLSNIFMPFYMSAPSGAILPTFASGILSNPSTIGPVDLLPFKYTNASGQINLIAEPQDSHKNILSGQSYQSPASFRTEQDMRGLGMRLPMMGVGWGYTTDGTPFPAGSGAGLFAGEVANGYEVDPKYYVAAPIDIRYDEERELWTAAGGGSMTRHRHLKNTDADGGPAFATFFADTLAEASGLGYFAILPELQELG
jgi:hypothetical protein